jgi:hypothetical protein
MGAEAFVNRSRRASRAAVEHANDGKSLTAGPPRRAARNFESGNRSSLPAPFRLLLQNRTVCRLTNLLLHFLLFHMNIRGDHKIAHSSHLTLDAIQSERAPVREVIEVRELLHAVEGSQLFFA